MAQIRSLIYGPAVVDDVDGADVSVDVRTAGVVRLSVGFNPEAHAHIDPAGARAVARALLEAADAAEEAGFEDTADHYPPTEGV